MADPFTAAMAGGSMIATVIGGATAAQGAEYSARAASDSARYQAQVADNNRIIAENNAMYARQAGQGQAYQNQYKTAQILGQQKANQGASGVDVNSGSPLDVRMSQAEMGELDTLTILDNAERKAVGYTNQGNDFSAKRDLLYSEADSDIVAGKYKVATTLLGTASSVGDKWAGYKQKGVF